jgi:hypothetical protein
MASTLTTTEPSPEAMATAYDQAAAALYLRRVRLGVNLTLMLSSVFGPTDPF